MRSLIHILGIADSLAATSEKPVRINLKRGFWRLWVVLTTFWIAGCGFVIYQSPTNSARDSSSFFYIPQMNEPSALCEASNANDGQKSSRQCDPVEPLKFLVISPETQALLASDANNQILDLSFETGDHVYILEDSLNKVEISVLASRFAKQVIGSRTNKWTSYTRAAQDFAFFGLLPPGFVLLLFWVFSWVIRGFTG